MTPEKTKEAFLRIHEILDKRQPFLKGKRLNEQDMQLQAQHIGYIAKHEHLMFMAEEGQKLVDSGRTEKAMRWLGFLQGALWGLSFTTIEEQKNINRPDDVAYDSKRI